MSTNDKPDTVDDEAVQFIIPPGEPLGELNRIQYLQSQLTAAKEEIEKLTRQLEAAKEFHMSKERTSPKKVKWYEPTENKILRGVIIDQTCYIKVDHKTKGGFLVPAEALQEISRIEKGE